MTIYAIVFGVTLFSVLLLWYWRRQQYLHNEKMLQIYNRCVQTLISDLIADQMSYEDYTIAVNILRNVYNSLLVGWNKKKLMLPHIKVETQNQMERSHRRQLLKKKTTK